jgi:hypothetical protein
MFNAQLLICQIELQNAQMSNTTGDDTGTKAGNKKIANKK